MRPDTPLQYISHYLDIANKKQEKGCADVKNALDIAAGLDPYLNGLNDHSSSLLNEISKISFETDWLSLFSTKQTSSLLTPEMLVDETEVRFLCFLMQMIQAKNILEVGMFTGYSAAALALVSDDEAIITTIERESYLVNQTQKLFSEYNMNEKIKIINQDAKHALNNFDKTFDFIFVDADKAGYWDYYQTILDKRLLSQNGILCIDNTLLKGSVYTKSVLHADAETMREFNARVSQDPRVFQVILPIRDGITLVRWKSEK